jgi:hypothetical protein
MQVINIKDYGAKLPPNTLYIGRKNAYYNLEASVLANPFHIVEAAGITREIVLDKYETYLRNRIESGTIHLPIILKDIQYLACWCAPLDCHGDVVIKLYKEYYNAE